MPWALEAVLAEVDADAIVFGGDYLYGPYPRETVATHPGARRPRRCAGTARTCAEEWERAQLARRRPAPGFRRCRSATTLDGVLYCHAAPDEQPADHDGDHAGRGGPPRPSPVSTRHGRDRPHPPSVRPQLRRPAGRQRRLGRDAVRGRGRGLLDARRGRGAVVPRARRSTSSEPSRRPARAPGRTRRSSWPRTCSSRSRATRRSRTWRAGAREGAASAVSGSRTASTARSSSSTRASTSAGGSRARGSSPAASR